MKKAIFTTLLFAYAYNSYSLSNLPLNDTKASQLLVPLIGTDIKINLNDFIKLRPYDYKKLTGKRLKWKDAIALKITQKQIKKTIRKDGTIDIAAFQTAGKESFKWHWGGFFLGLLLPIVGTIITLFFKDPNKKNRMISSLFGLSLAAGIVLIIAAISAASYYG